MDAADDRDDGDEEGEEGGEGEDDPLPAGNLLLVGGDGDSPY